MSDNTRLNPGTGGDLISTDDLGSGVKVQRVKVQHGADGSATDVSTASPMPVDLTNVTSTAPLAVDISSLSGWPSDGFGRLRISEAVTLFDSKLVYDAQSLYWVEAQTGGASAGSWSAADARVRLTVAASQTSTRQTRRHFIYEPGKSALTFVTFNLHGAEAGYKKRVGRLGNSNGVYLELNETTPRFYIKSGSSAGDQSVNQASWNLDTMDGNGSSGIDIDWTMTQILVIDWEWLGVGSVRLGFVVDGITYFAHKFTNANNLAAVYMSTPNLPVRYEIEGLAGAAGSAYMDCICCSVIAEGGNGNPGVSHSYVRTSATGNVASSASGCVLSIRTGASYPRVSIKPDSLSVLASSASNFAWELVLNGTLSGATWAAQTGSPTNGYADVDTAATSCTGGTVLHSGLVSLSDRATSSGDLSSFLALGADIAGTTLDTLSIRVTNLSNGSETYRASLDWRVRI